MIACEVYEMESLNETTTIILQYFMVFTIFLALFLVLFIYTICAEISRVTYVNGNSTEHRPTRDTMIRASEESTTS